jgi:hypothetical protein
VNVKKERRPDVCAAMRCVAPPEVTVPGICWDNVPEEERVHLCGKHGEIARVDFALDEVPGALRPINGEVSPDEVEAVLEASTELAEEPAPEEEERVVRTVLYEHPAAAAERREATTPGNVLDGMTPEALALVEDATEASPLGMPAAELAQETEEARGILEQAREMEIQTQEDLEFAAEVLKEAKGRAKRLEERQKEITAPLNAALKSVRDLFRAPLDFYATLERELKGRIAELKMREAEENRKAMAAAAAAHAEGNAAATGAALSTVKNVANVAGVSTREVWDFEIEDENAIPRAFLMPNLRAIADKSKGLEKGSEPAAIPGVRWIKRVAVSARSA